VAALGAQPGKEGRGGAEACLGDADRADQAAAGSVRAGGEDGQQPRAGEAGQQPAVLGGSDGGQ
jgi:hypothetical protein